MRRSCAGLGLRPACQHFAARLGHLGSDKIPVPKSGDEAGFDQAMSKLGWPREASGYSYEPPNDIELKGVIQGEKLSDDPLFQLAHKALHEGRATGEQYKRVMNALVKGVADFTAASRGERTKELEAYKAERQAEVNDLRKEWGGKFDENMAVAKRAALAFGFTPEQFEAIEAVAGAKTLLSGFHNMGRRIGEIGSDLGGQGGSFGPASPEAALAELSRLESDKEFRAAFYDRTHAGHKEAVAKHNQLSALAYPSRTSVVPHAGQQR